MTIKDRFMYCAVGLVLVLAASSFMQARPVPDLILHSGKIITVNAQFDLAEALAIQDGRIIAVGSNKEVLALRGKRTQVIDLRGRTVIPGLIDSHSHPTADGMTIFRPDLSGAKSVAEIVNIIAAKVRASGPGEWVTNSRIWNETKLAERRNPTRSDLDPISPNNPVYLSRGHLGVINTAAMKTLGITEETPNPPGGTFERDPATGMLSGRLYERAQDIVRAALPQPTHEQLMASQRQSFKELSTAGVTSVRSAADTADGMRAFIDLHNRGELPLRTSVNILINPSVPAKELEAFFKQAPVASGLGDEMLRVWGIKMIADGGSDLAYLRSDYVNRPGFRGQVGGTLEDFTNAVKICNRYGWRVGIHALGDAAIDLVLDAYEAADKESPISGKRWSIEHGYLMQPEHFARIQRLGLVIHPQTWHLYHLRRNFLENYGSKYANMSHPYRAFIDHHIPIAGGADEPIESSSDQFFSMWVEVTRATIDGEIVGAEQKLSREEALRFHTIWAAYSTFEEKVKGSLEPGKFADLVVLSDDYLTVPQDRIRDIAPVLTMVGGKVVFKSKGEAWPSASN